MCIKSLVIWNLVVGLPFCLYSDGPTIPFPAKDTIAHVITEPLNCNKLPPSSPAKSQAAVTAPSGII